jgi:hypothetical protein
MPEPKKKYKLNTCTTCVIPTLLPTPKIFLKNVHVVIQNLDPPHPKLTTCVTPVRRKKNLNLRKKSEIELGKTGFGAGSDSKSSSSWRPAAGSDSKFPKILKPLFGYLINNRIGNQN